ncbi:hypothetical protein Tco_0445879 [Tanacetum coccineum]
MDSSFLRGGHVRYSPKLEYLQLFPLTSSGFVRVIFEDLKRSGVETEELKEPDMVELGKPVVDWLVIEKLDLDDFDGFD